LVLNEPTNFRCNQQQQQTFHHLANGGFFLPRVVLFAGIVFFMFSVTGWFETDLTRRHQPPFDINGTEFLH
jgi:hypothetical protein